MIIPQYMIVLGPSNIKAKAYLETGQGQKQIQAIIEVKCLT